MNAPRPVRAATAVVVAVLAGLVSYVALRLWVDGGHPFPHPSWAELGALLLIGGTALVLGRRVRRMALGIDGARVSPLTAARTFVLAQACVVTGAALAGAHAGAALALGPETTATGTWSSMARTLVLALAAATVAATGLVVQRWCRRPDDPDGPADGEEPA